MLINSSDVQIKKVSEEGTVGVFSFDPLPTGFGNTLGNTLRRVLLTSLEGSAITQMKVSGALHQFSAVNGIKEDLVEIGLNLKQVRAKVHGENPVVAKLEKTGSGKITAKDIDAPADIEIVNKDQHICTLSDKKSKIDMEIVFEPGVGYSPVEERETSKVGVILLDALFSPVVNVTYTVEPTRMGRVIGLDKLVVEVETDGTILPSEAIGFGAGILRDFFARFAMGEDKEPEKEEAEVEEDISEVEDIAVDELPLPTRTINALKKGGVKTLHQISEKSEEELADIKNLGEKSIEEINKLLEEEGIKS